MWIVAETRRLVTANQAKDVDGQIKPNAERTRKIIAAIHRIAPEPSPSPSVIATSTQHREQHENNDERPQQRTHGNAPHQRQHDQNDKQNDDQVHAHNPTPESRHEHP
jgi:hypothetical protein